MDAATLAGLVGGLALWIGLVLGVHRWGSPGEESQTSKPADVEEKR